MKYIEKLRRIVQEKRRVHQQEQDEGLESSPVEEDASVFAKETTEKMFANILSKYPIEEADATEKADAAIEAVAELMRQDMQDRKVQE